MGCRQKLEQPDTYPELNQHMILLLAHLKSNFDSLINRNSSQNIMGTMDAQHLTYGETPIAHVFSETQNSLKPIHQETSSNSHFQLIDLEDLLIFISCLELVH